MPAWIATSTETGAAFTWQRNVLSLGGDLAALQNSDGTAAIQLTNPHGDLVAGVDDDTAATGTSNYFEQTEYGAPRGRNTSNPDRYGWLGGKRRSADALAGVILMGVRLYNPTTGRFLQTDPIPGGSANDYDYSYQDPINRFDLNGRCGWCHKALHWANLHAVVHVDACFILCASVALNHGRVFLSGSAAGGNPFSGFGLPKLTRFLRLGINADGGYTRLPLDQTESTSVFGCLHDVYGGCVQVGSNGKKGRARKAAKVLV